MSTSSTWDGPASLLDDDTRLLAMLRQILKHIMTQFAAQGACIALLDEHINQMRVQLHIRQRISASPGNPGHSGINGTRSGRITAYLGSEMSSLPSDDLQDRYDGTVSDTFARRDGSLVDNLASFPTLPQPSISHKPPDEFEDVRPQQSGLLAVGTTYPKGIDMIGKAWQENEAAIIRHDDYQAFKGSAPLRMDVIPASYFVIPIQEPYIVSEPHLSGGRRSDKVLGVLVLYQIHAGGVTGFQLKRLPEIAPQIERIALYSQNGALQRSQRRTSKYMQLIQQISTVFPNKLKLLELVQTLCMYASDLVDVSATLVTLYDRDVERIYDVFTVRDAISLDGLAGDPVGEREVERPIWWHVTQQEQKRLLFSPTQEREKAHQYRELLGGLWGDQSQSETFLLLPMKMFNRVIGSFSLTSMHPNAYNEEAIQVLETMVQIVTVSIENTKLYERDRQLLREAKDRESHLAELNSALQFISAGLDVVELLNNLVTSVAKVMSVDTCVYFRPSRDEKYLTVQALYAPSRVNDHDDSSGKSTPASGESAPQTTYSELFEAIQLPFQHTMLEQSVKNGLGFFYLTPPMVEELIQKGEENVGIFFHTTQVQQMLMIPMWSQTELMGLLAVPTPTGTAKEPRNFRPKDVGTLLAICAQTMGAIRNAQLFGEREEAYAELERLNGLKDEFLVTASHELRTPLSAINGYATLLKRQSARITPANVLRYATKISGAAQQLNDLMNNMTEASRVGRINKKLELQISEVQVLAAAEVAANMLSINIEQQISLSVDNQLWVKGDPLHVRQVMTNLLDNAAKYSSPESHITLTAEGVLIRHIAELRPQDQFDLSSETSVVLVRVIDQGEGVAPEDQEKIFDKFVRAPRSLTTPVRGSGLGLYICRRYIEAMGGKLWLERSVPNEGSTFSFYLPATTSPLEKQDESAFM